MERDLSKNHKPINTSVETFYYKTVDSMILKCDRPVGITALILLNKTQDS